MKATIDIPEGMSAEQASRALVGLVHAMRAADEGVPITSAVCPECGPGCGWDEDGCCSCGEDIFHDENGQRRPENFAVLMSMPDDAVEAVAAFARALYKSLLAELASGHVDLSNLISVLQEAGKHDGVAPV